jgi:hypothetical protein
MPGTDQLRGIRAYASGQNKKFAPAYTRRQQSLTERTVLKSMAGRAPGFRPAKVWKVSGPFRPANEIEH